MRHWGVAMRQGEEQAMGDSEGDEVTELGKTWFAPAGRARGRDLQADIATVSGHELTGAVLSSADGMLGVLNRSRQVVALNHRLLETLGVPDPADVLGLRLGEAVGCIHAHDNPEGGCGTGSACSTCGAVIAMVSALSRGEPVERNCCIRYRRDEREHDVYLGVRSQPFSIGKEKYLLIFLRDITREQDRAALERAFFHELGNVVTPLLANAEFLLAELGSEAPAVADLALQARLLVSEIRLHRMLLGVQSGEYEIHAERITVRRVFAELERFAGRHAASARKSIVFAMPAGDLSVRTDQPALLRVLGNMTVNALEACSDGEEVRVWTEADESSVSFHVANPRPLPAEVASRIFQRNFSTKGSLGRGLGTHVMKVIGEKALGGRVDFYGSTETVFRFRLPREP